MAFNRTKVELKRDKSMKAADLKQSFNRTKVELKRIQVRASRYFSETFNRTKVELKRTKVNRKGVLVSLLIVPKWN